MDAQHEEVEALKKWWSENGRSVVVGLVVGLGAVFGWTTWQGYKESRAELASQRYQQLVDAAIREEHEIVDAQAKAIVDEFTSSGYAPLSAMVGARSALALGRRAQAEQHLRWVVDNAGREDLRDLARLRLARLSLDAGEPEAALARLDAVATRRLASLVAEVRGDVLLAGGETQAARSAYAEALAGEDLSSASRLRLRMKLDDLGADPANAGG